MYPIRLITLLLPQESDSFKYTESNSRVWKQGRFLGWYSIEYFMFMNMKVMDCNNTPSLLHVLETRWKTIGFQELLETIAAEVQAVKLL